MLLKLNTFTNCFKDKSTLKWNSSANEKYEYRHLGTWYIKSILYKSFLNWNKTFNKIVIGKTLSFVIGPFLFPFYLS